MVRAHACVPSVLCAACLLAFSPAGLAQGARKAAAPASGVRADDNTPDCPRLWREYRRSQACYARHATVHGVNGNAAQACGPQLLDPSAVCGPVRDAAGERVR